MAETVDVVSQVGRAAVEAVETPGAVVAVVGAELAMEEKVVGAAEER